MFTITNQKPTDLSPTYTPVVSGDYNPIDHLKQTITTPILSQKINQNVDITIQDNNGQNLSEDDIINIIIACSGETIDPDSEDMLKELFGKMLVNYDQNTKLSTQEAFVLQSSKREKMLEPTSKIIYTPATDIIPASKAFLAGQASLDLFFASLAFYARPTTLGFYFANESIFNEFKKWLKQEIAGLQSVLPVETNQMFQEFDQLSLNSLTESLLLRNDDSDNNSEYSFARCIIYYLMKYTDPNYSSSSTYGVLPFRIDELANPKTIVFVNIEKHAHATSKQIANEWDIINKSLQNRPVIVSNNKLKKLTSTQRNITKVKQKALNQISLMNQNIQKAQRLKFQRTAPTSVDLTKRIKKLLNKMGQINRSDNTFKSIKMTYQKANRRNPDDFNKPGKIVSTKYKPDIHLYIDTSGSISERNYQDAVKACIKMAKKLNINLYFNSFSHVLSQATKLETKDKTYRDIYRQFQKVPKVTGGTDYEQIWHYINRNKKRQRELSIIMTDFEWYPPNKFVEQPKNLYYAPISVEQSGWDWLVSNAKDFCKAMVSFDPKIRGKLLF